MKGLLIAIILLAVIFAIAALIEKYSKDPALVETAELVKDAVGILYCMLIFWLLYCVIC